MGMFDKITFGQMRAAAVPRVIRTHGADWQRLRYGIEQAPKMGRPPQRDTVMLFFLLTPWILFNILHVVSAAGAQLGNVMIHRF